MKTEIEQLISHLASKELTFGCEVKVPEDWGERILRVTQKPYDNGVVRIDDDSLDAMEGADVYKIQILGHPIRIGDVLEKMFEGNTGLCHEQYRFFRKLGVLVKVRLLLFHWWRIGFTKSLQEIYAEAEWEVVETRKPSFPAARDGIKDLAPKQPAIRELMTFLLTLGL